MKHVVLNIFPITKLAKCKQFQLVISRPTTYNAIFLLNQLINSFKNNSPSKLALEVEFRSKAGSR